MKPIIYIVVFLFTTFSFGQSMGLIVGKVLDKEANNEPLVLANVSIKGSTAEFSTDMTGLFVIENLETGHYTLVCSFAGYETQEIKVYVDALKPVEIKLSLAASTVSLSELALITGVSQKDDKSLVVLN